MSVLTKEMGGLIIERKKQQKSVDDYADGVMDMYNILVRMINENKLVIIEKGEKK